MSDSSTFVPVIVAVIGVVGAVVPAVYVNSLHTQPNPDITLSVLGSPWEKFHSFNTNNSSTGRTYYIYDIYIQNEFWNAPATNLSIIVEPRGPRILGVTMAHLHPIVVNIANDFSTIDLKLPQYNNTILEPGSNKTINDSPLEMRIPKFMNGIGSRILLTVVTQDDRGLGVYAAYDQGSDRVNVKHTASGTETFISATSSQPLNFTKATEDYMQQVQVPISTLFSPGLIQFYVIFLPHLVL